MSLPPQGASPLHSYTQDLHAHILTTLQTVRMLHFILGGCFLILCGDFFAQLHRLTCLFPKPEHPHSSTQASLWSVQLSGIIIIIYIVPLKLWALQLFHFKLKTLPFNKSYPDSSSSPYLPPRLNSKQHHTIAVILSACLTLWL